MHTESDHPEVWTLGPVFINTGLLRIFFLLTLLGWPTLMLEADLFLTLVSLTFVPVLVWRGTFSSLGLRKNWLQIQERLSLLTKVMDENLNGIRVVRERFTHGIMS